MTIIYTIGHSNHPIDRFLSLLGRYGIRRLADVRSHPYSRWAPQFGKRTLEQALEHGGVDYVFLGESLGGRPAGAGNYQADGRLDYALRARACDFQQGVRTLLEMAAERPTIVLCAEEDPARCHRRTLITPALLAASVEVAHIRGDGRLQAEAPEDAPDRQLGLFS